MSKNDAAVIGTLAVLWLVAFFAAGVNLYLEHGALDRIPAPGGNKMHPSCPESYCFDFDNATRMLSCVKCEAPKNIFEGG